MRIDLEDIRRNYASLPDGALLALNPAELSDVARPLYDEELSRRGLRPGQKLEDPDQPNDEISDEQDEFDELEIDDGPDPDWLEEAACACAFAVRSATTDLPEAAKARAILRDARIPSHVTLTREDQPRSNRRLCMRSV